MKLSITRNGGEFANKNWGTIDVRTFGELEETVKSYPYSQTIFENNYRNIANSTSFNPVMIYDIDNEPDDKHLTMKEALELFNKHNVSAMIVPTKSNMVEKFTKKGKSKGIVERFRIIVPTKTALPNNIEKDVYVEFERLTAIVLKLRDYLDSSASNDIARYYAPSPKDSEVLVGSSKRVMPITQILEVSQENVIQQRIVKEQKRVQKR